MATKTITLEDALLHPLYAYEYARYEVRGQFPEGEHVIAQNPYCAYVYAREVIKGRFPAGEHVIAQDPYYANRYFNDFKKLFSEQEKVLWLLKQ
jgi:hypothetical protein